MPRGWQWANSTAPLPPPPQDRVGSRGQTAIDMPGSHLLVCNGMLPPRQEALSRAGRGEDRGPGSLWKIWVNCVSLLCPRQVRDHRHRWVILDTMRPLGVESTLGLAPQGILDTWSRWSFNISHLPGLSLGTSELGSML